jgi:hypothetical protein
MKAAERFHHRAARISVRKSNHFACLPQLRLSSITLAPCRKVIGVPGQRSQAARNVARATW